MTIIRGRRRESGLHWSAVFSLLTIIAFTQAALSQVLRSTFVESPNANPPAGSVLLYDNFIKDSELNPNLWTTGSAFLTAVVNAADSPSPAFVSPTLVFGGESGGMEMSGPEENYQATGVQSLSTFAPPFSAFIHVAPTS